MNAREGASVKDYTAACDAMTKLRDRGTFFREIARCKAEDIRGHVILVQPSQLLQVNRMYGVPTGDALIRSIAQYLDTLDPAYTAYRVASSRFMLLGPACGRAQAEAFAEGMSRRFSESWAITAGEQTSRIQVKTYLAHLFLSPEDAEENALMDKLDYAVSLLSEKGSAGLLFFDDALKQAMDDQTYVLEELRYAIENETFQMYYQPIYSCREKRFTSAESLIRLFDQRGGFISPGKFIPMAEANGLIDQISRIVLEKVCAFLGAHPELPLRTVSVNLTGEQVLAPDFIQQIRTLLDTYRLDGSRLRIEITERTVTEDFPAVKRVMERLEAWGIRFYLDDFGTGYSNLASMLSLPFEVIKFDQSLIRVMDGTPQGQRTIGLLAEIMHENRYEIVAEGIETEVQAHMAYEKELDRIQGFFYAKPLPEDALLAFLKENAD